METIKEDRITFNDGVQSIRRGVYFDPDKKTYTWLTFSRSGRCKSKNAALKKAGFTPETK